MSHFHTDYSWQQLTFTAIIMLRISLRRVNTQLMLNLAVRGIGVVPTSSSSALLHRHHALSNVFPSSQRRYFFSSLFSSTKKSEVIDPVKEENSKRTPMSAQGEKLLYEGETNKTITPSLPEQYTTLL